MMWKGRTFYQGKIGSWTLYIRFRCSLNYESGCLINFQVVDSLITYLNHIICRHFCLWSEKCDEFVVPQSCCCFSRHCRSNPFSNIDIWVSFHIDVSLLKMLGKWFSLWQQHMASMMHISAKMVSLKLKKKRQESKCMYMSCITSKYGKFMYGIYQLEFGRAHGFQPYGCARLNRLFTTMQAHDQLTYNCSKLNNWLSTSGVFQNSPQFLCNIRLTDNIQLALNIISLQHTLSNGLLCI